MLSSMRGLSMIGNCSHAGCRDTFGMTKNQEIVYSVPMEISGWF